MITVPFGRIFKYATVAEYERICFEFEEWCYDHCDPSEWRWAYTTHTPLGVNVNNKVGIRFEKATDATAFKLRFNLCS
jgi:hypothetical protein